VAGTGASDVDAQATPPAATADGPVVVARGLVRRFDGLTAVDGVSFDVMRGEVFGFTVAMTVVAATLFKRSE